MAQDEVVIKYRIDTSEFGKVGAAVTDVSKKVDDLKVKAQAAFASGQLDAATNKLIQQGDVMGALIERYGSATAALKGLEKEMQTMAALGQRNTKEFKELARVTAELKDSVQDTRGEIKKMASDTRVFDTMVQGARGVAAAFSVATGVAAAFGDENKDLQKTLLKVQGAMAALQGVQELANIATEKGGIASKAYAAALQVVDRVSKITGLSMAASWALATGGVTVLITGVSLLISYLGDAKTKSQELEEQERKRKEEFGKGFTSQVDAVDALDKRQELEYKRAKLRGEDLKKLTQRQLIERLSLILQLQKETEYNNETNAIDDATYSKLSTQLEKERVDTLLKLRENGAKKSVEIKKAQREKEQEIDNVGEYRLPEKKVDLEVKGLNIKPEEISIEKLPEVKVDLPIPKLSLGEQITKLAGEVNKSLEVIAPYARGISSIVSGVYQTQTANIEAEHQKQLASAGDNAKKREKIEKEFAIRSAKIARNQAITDKLFATFEIALSLSRAIAKATEKGFPAAIADVALASAIAGGQLAAVAARPLPVIPTFEKGGRVLAGGRKDDGMLFGRSHRDGGILIEAQGGEYIWDIPTVKKHGDVIKAAHENRLEQHVFHKYVVPQMQKGRAAQGQNESYDDFMLRTTVKNSGKDTADRIVNGLAKVLKKDSYLISRYG